MHRRCKPSRGKRKKFTPKNKLTYGIVAVVVGLICFFAFFSFYSNKPSLDDKKTSPKAALIDHLGFSSPPPNKTFNGLCRTILEDTGFSYTYHRGEEVTVDFYRELPTYGYDLIILRVHSAIISNETSGGPFLGFFTSEIYDETNLTLEQDIELRHARLAVAFFPEQPGKKYFGITEWFVRDRMNGNFEDTVIIMMGCEGLNHTSMAKELHQKGAKVYISWTGLVSISHTDKSTIHLLQNLLQENQTIKDAVKEIGPDPTWRCKLDYYPKGTEDVGNYRVPHFISGLTINVAKILPIFDEPRPFRHKLL